MELHHQSAGVDDGVVCGWALTLLRPHPRNVDIYGDEDVTELQESIAESGWIKPLTVNPDHVVISGHRRYRAALALGYTKIPVEIEKFPSKEAELERLLRENENRGKTPEQQIREGMTWEPLEEKKARIQRLANLKQGTNSPERENFPIREDGRVIDIIARRVGLGTGKTYEKGKDVVVRIDKELESGDTFRYASILRSQLNEQSITAAWNTLDKIVKAEEKAEQEQEQRRIEIQAQNEKLRTKGAMLPVGKYACLVVDPPWPIQWIERDVRPNQVALEYPTMTEEELQAFPLPDLAGDDCHLYLWTTQKHIPMAHRLAEYWGFKYQCQLTWVKNVGFTPYSWMYSTEHILFCTRGSLPLLRLGKRLDFQANVREHSRKPDEFYDLVKEVSPGPRLDVFSREKRDGFDQYGNETDKYEGTSNFK